MTNKSIVKFIHIKHFDKDNILAAYESRNDYVYEINDLWESVREFCRGEIHNFKESYSEPVETVIVVNLDKIEKNKTFIYTDIQYLLAMMYNIHNVKLCFYQNCQGNQSDYYRLSIFLNLWVAQNALENDVRFYDLSDKTNYALKRLSIKRNGLQSISNSTRNEMSDFISCISDRLFPIIEIDKKTYELLSETYVAPTKEEILNMTFILKNPEFNKKVNSTEKYAKAYLYGYIAKMSENFSQETGWTDYINNYKPSLLATALFVTITECLIRNKENVENYKALIELCYSYACGLLQLIENAYKHVIDNNNGNGFFCFLLHEKNEELKRFLKDRPSNNEIAKCKYFLEFIVLDCAAKGETLGIVDKFNHSLHINGVTESIKDLKEVFEYPAVRSDALDEYYRKDAQNVAYHYGLQIFAGVVSANNGFLSLKSGNGQQPYTYTNINSDDTNYKNPFNQVKSINHYAGTTYNIILPVIKPQTKDINYNLFLGNIPCFKIDKKDFKVFFSSAHKENADYGENVKDCLNSLLLGYNQEPIVNIDCKNIILYKELEYICKALLVAISDNSKPIKALCLTNFDNEFYMLDAVRIISLFYNKIGKCLFMKDKGIFLYNYDETSNKEYELYFSGENIYTVLSNIERQKLLKTIDQVFYRNIDLFLHTVRTNDCFSEQIDKAISATFIKYLLKLPNSNCSIIQKQLKDILATDIHTNELGCKIEKTHIRIGTVHLDTFYEAQFLFGNAYWTDVFAIFIYDFICNKIDSMDNKPNNVILYGYETYSTLMLYKAQRFLANAYNNSIGCQIIVYEKNNELVRYIEKLSDLESNVLVIYVIGISSTLSTFKQMNDALIKNDGKYGCFLSECISLIQINGIGSENFITPSKDNLAYLSKRNYLDFAVDKKAYYFVTAESKWYAAEESGCELCIPSNYLEERPLIEVNETSVVPTQMIRLNKSETRLNESETNNNIDDNCGVENAEKFLNCQLNCKYLRYGHIEQHDNHFQYFFISSILYNDFKDDIEKWLETVPNMYKEAFTLSSPNAINILIAPRHISNIGFVNSINECVFKGEAHIIELDIRKEYRSNFITKYSNYQTLAKKIRDKKDKQEKTTINFYYVNDQIISGKTFYRATSLINSLIGLTDSETKSQFNMIKGIFTLVDRNSYDTRKLYVSPLYKNSGEEYLPFFSYLRFYIPSLRNHDDSCPLCGQNKIAKEIVDSAAFSSTAYHWQEKIIYHRVMSSNETQVDKKKSDRSFIRLQCENELWKNLKKYQSLNGIDPRERTYNLEERTYNGIIEIIKNRRKSLAKLEFDNIKFEKQNEKRLQLLQKRFKFEQSSLLDYVEQDEFIIDTYLNEMPESLLYDLFRITIARLCAIGSCALLNKERLDCCLRVGKYLHNKKIRAQEQDSEKSYENIMGEYLISYIKVVSRPLLFYQEEIKKAVLKLLLEIFDCFIRRFGGDINSNEESLDKDDYFNEQNFESFLLNSVKRLLCYDKGISKYNICDKLLFNEDKNLNNFYTRLYIENNKGIRLNKNDKEKRWPFTDNDDSISKYDAEGNIDEKYKYIIQQLNKIVGNKIEIGFFVVNEDTLGNENSATKKLSYIKIGNKDLAAPSSEVEDFYFSNGIYYIKIGNNYDKFEDKDNFSKVSDSTQNAYIIMSVRTEKLRTLRIILAYRKEILKEIEKDFNNGIVKKLITATDLAKILTYDMYESHANFPYTPFNQIIEQIHSMLNTAQQDKNLIIGLKSTLRLTIDAYMDTVIPIAYKDLIRRKINFVTIDNKKVTIPTDHLKRSTSFFSEDNSYNFSLNANDGIRYAMEMLLINENCLKDYNYFSHILIKDIEILYKDNSQTYELIYEKNNDLCICEKIDELFEDYQFIVYFSKDVNVSFEPFMIMDILIKNAIKHGEYPIVISFEKNNLNNIDFIIKNDLKKNDDSSGHGISLKALENLFGTETENAEKSKMTCFSHSVNNGKFIAKIKNFITIIPEKEDKNV